MWTSNMINSFNAFQTKNLIEENRFFEVKGEKIMKIRFAW